MNVLFTFRTVAPLCYLYNDVVQLYYVFRKMYMHFFYRLHSISSHPQVSDMLFVILLSKPASVHSQLIQGCSLTPFRCEKLFLFCHPIALSLRHHYRCLCNQSHFFLFSALHVSVAMPDLISSLMSLHHFCCVPLYHLHLVIL